MTLKNRVGDGHGSSGDIDLLSKIAKPKIALVTLIGESHLEFFGTRDKIAEGKLELKRACAQMVNLLCLQIRLLISIYQQTQNYPFWTR